MAKKKKKGKKKPKPGVLARRRHAIFMRRTSYSFRSHRLRAEESKQPALSYTLEDLRASVSRALLIPCPYCSGELTIRTFSCDHVVPVVRGGSFEITNVAICCKKCNGTKGNMTGAEFMELRSLLATWPPEIKQDVLARLRAGGQIARYQTLKIPKEGPSEDQSLTAGSRGSILTKLPASVEAPAGYTADLV